jgi:transcription elongation factor GreA
MTAQKPLYLTADGLQKLRDELHQLRSRERPRISQAIAEARSKGDLSENAEYDAAKEEQGLVEARISRLEGEIANARLVDESKVDGSKAFILSNVEVENQQTGTKHTYTLVSAHEADLSAGKISVASPIGKSLLGREVGDIVDVKVPAGKVELRILGISR